MTSQVPPSGRTFDAAYGLHAGDRIPRFAMPDPVGRRCQTPARERCGTSDLWVRTRNAPPARNTAPRAISAISQASGLHELKLDCLICTGGAALDVITVRSIGWWPSICQVAMD